MYLFWKQNALGSIAVSAAGLRTFARRYVAKPFRCDLVTLPAGEDSLFAMLSFPSGSDSAKMKATEEEVKAAFEKLGFAVRISWMEADEASPGVLRRILGLVGVPVLLAFLGGAATLLFTAGLKPFFWAVVWGAAFYFVSAFIFSPKGGHILEKLKGFAGR
ncbi:MAG: hypothetical protein ACOYJV_09830 [Aminivibrio sp.]|jgi:hypothetical protein